MENKKYGIASLRKQFPNDEACLQFIFDALYSRKCSRLLGRDLSTGQWDGHRHLSTACGGVYKRISGRRQFQCSKCRLQIAPTAKTIFCKSNTPLVLWFHAILAFLNAKGGISAKQLERDLEISYKCAWRILSLIRRVLESFPHLYTRGLSYTDVLALVTNTELSGARQSAKKKKKKMSHRKYLV
ncbi:MAG: hypothetical protein AAB830_00720 [Patescibacteria group bacterium]|mgnify:CR=1 FL=1